MMPAPKLKKCPTCKKLGPPNTNELGPYCSLACYWKTINVIQEENDDDD